VCKGLKPVRVGFCVHFLSLKSALLSKKKVCTSLQPASGTSGIHSIEMTSANSPPEMGRLSSSFQRYANRAKAAPWCRVSPSFPLMHRMPIRGELSFDQWATLTAPARQNGSTQLQLEKQLLHYIPYSWIINLQLWSIWVIIKRQWGNAFDCVRKESLSPKSGQCMTQDNKETYVP